MPSSITHCHSLADTEALAASFAQTLTLCDVVTLTGDLGAGKTTFCQTIIRTLVDESLEVTSPTFTLVQLYDQCSIPIWHVDLYRIESEEEVYELGLEEAFDTAITLIEWPSRAPHIIPSNAITIDITFGEQEDERLFTITRSGS